MPDTSPESDRLKRLRFRAWHRGTREADLIVGGFADRFGADFSEADYDWFERLLAEADADILNWITGKAPVPDWLDGPLMTRMKRLDYIPISK